jgi:Asp/Glu/hydantoin racemase
MPKVLALIHTVTSLVPVFGELCRELLPSLQVFNIVDESLLKNTIREGSMSKLTAQRLLSYFISAEQAGADAAMVTCSSVGAVVEQAGFFVNIPVFRVDQAMADKAVDLGRCIGVAVTLQTTLDPTINLVKNTAAVSAKDVEIVSKLCEGAFEAVIAGDTEKHDKLVRSGLDELRKNADVIVLAQASMARVAEQMHDSGKSQAILSSPRLAVENLAKILN